MARYDPPFGFGERGAVVRIKMVSLEDGITSCGFRKMAAFVARINDDAESCYVSTNRYRNIRNGLRGTLGSAGSSRTRTSTSPRVT